VIFDRFAAMEIVEYMRHPVRSPLAAVLTTYAKGKFTERSRNGEVRQRFSSRPSARR